MSSKTTSADKIAERAEVFLRIKGCFERAKSLEELCVLLRLSNVTVPEKIDLGFLKWVLSYSTRPFSFAISSFLASLSANELNDLFIQKPIIEEAYQYQYVKRVVRYVHRFHSLVFKHAKTHINELVSEDRAAKWLKCKILGKHGRKSGMSEFKDTLLYYWVKVNGRFPNEEGK